MNLFQLGVQWSEGGPEHPDGELQLGVEEGGQARTRQVHDIMT